MGKGDKYTEEFINEADEVDEYDLPDWFEDEEIKKSEETDINKNFWQKWL